MEMPSGVLSTPRTLIFLISKRSIPGSAFKVVLDVSKNDTGSFLSLAIVPSSISMGISKFTASPVYFVPETARYHSLKSPNLSFQLLFSFGSQECRALSSAVLGTCKSMAPLVGLLVFAAPAVDDGMFGTWVQMRPNCVQLH